MPTITEILASGTTFGLVPRDINEGISEPKLLTNYLGRFGDNYDISSNSNLYRFLLALGGEAGAGSLKKEVLYTKLQRQLEATHFTDLDRLFGGPLGISRRVSEIYQIDPRSNVLTQEQWIDVLIKDAKYRSRCLTWMRAVMAGPTPEGIALAGEAAIGVRCDVVERYQYIENQASDLPASVPDIGQTDSRNEFTIVPQTLTITQEERRAAIHLVDRLRPTNSIPTVLPGEPTTNTIDITSVASSSDGFYVKRLVTGRSDIDWPALSSIDGLWIDHTEKEAPTYAFMNRQESITYVTIISATASSEHVGQFNQEQRSVFPKLASDFPEDKLFAASDSFSRAFAPIQLSIPWTANP